MTTKAIKQKRTRHSVQYKLQVVEQALSGNKPIAQLARELGLHAPNAPSRPRHFAGKSDGRPRSFAIFIAQSGHAPKNRDS